MHKRAFVGYFYPEMMIATLIYKYLIEITWDRYLLVGYS